MKLLITRTVTGVVFISLIILIFFTPAVYSHILFLLFALLAIQEYYHIMAKLRKKDNPLQNIALYLLPLFWIVLPFVIVSIWMNYFSQKNLVLALFIIIWLYDTLAYCIGSLIGKHKMFKKISPKKSWEGFIGALILTVIISVSFYYIPYFEVRSFTSPVYWIIFATIIVIAGTFGDFAESYLKRKVDVKDSGNILPGHGGILDRFDSFFFAAPIGFAYWIVTV